MSSSSSTPISASSSLSLDSDDNDTMITLRSNDDKLFSIEKKNVISGLVKTAMEGDNTAKEIPVNVHSKTLQIIVDYMNKKNGNPKRVISQPLKDNILSNSVSNEDKWEVEFIEKLKPNEELWSIVEMCNYMDIESLLHLSCAKVASLVKGKSDKEIKVIMEKLKSKSA